MILPILPIRAQPKTAQVPNFIIGTTGGQMGHWDGVAASAGFAGSDYASQCLECTGTELYYRSGCVEKKERRRGSIRYDYLISA